MLCVTRKYQDTVRIETPSGEIIDVWVCSIGQGAVKLGFVADKSVAILRGELRPDKTREEQSDGRSNGRDRDAA